MKLVIMKTQKEKKDKQLKRKIIKSLPILVLLVMFALLFGVIVAYIVLPLKGNDNSEPVRAKTVHFLTTNGSFEAESVERRDDGCYTIKNQYPFFISGIYCGPIQFEN